MSMVKYHLFYSLILIISLIYFGHINIAKEHIYVPFILAPEKGVRLEAKGKESCSLGSKITSRIECEKACSKLYVGPLATLKDGKACYKAANGKCRQDGRRGSGASLICHVE